MKFILGLLSLSLFSLSAYAIPFDRTFEVTPSSVGSTVAYCGGCSELKARVTRVNDQSRLQIWYKTEDGKRKTEVFYDSEDLLNLAITTGATDKWFFAKEKDKNVIIVSVDTRVDAINIRSIPLSAEQIAAKASCALNLAKSI